MFMHLDFAQPCINCQHKRILKMFIFSVILNSIVFSQKNNKKKKTVQGEIVIAIA